MRALYTAVAIVALTLPSFAIAAPVTQQKARADKAPAKMGKIPKSCRYKGKKLWGKVQVVKNFPDFKVQVVNNFPDLKVQKVRNFPSKCGKWKFVKNFPDFKVKFVKNFPDFKIKFVKNFPGVR